MNTSKAYVELLSIVARNDDPPYWFNGRDSKRDMMIRELTDEGFLKTQFCKGAVEAVITYSGRMELENLKAQRNRFSFFNLAKWSSIVIAISSAVSAIAAVVLRCK